MLTLINKLQSLLDKTHAIDFIGPLALRLYLSPIFWMAGSQKFTDMPSTIAWFGSTDWGLGFPLPALMAWMAALTETAGAVLLLIGLGVRWISIPLVSSVGKPDGKKLKKGAECFYSLTLWMAEFGRFNKIPRS